MYRICLLVFFLLISPVFQGCGIFDFLKGDSDEDTSTVKVKKEQIQEEVDRLRAENIELKKRMDLLKNESKASMDESLGEITKAEEERKVLSDLLRKSKEENQKLTSENTRLEEILQKLQKKPHPDLKIKVLSGNGDLGSAKMMTKKLMEMEYDVSLIGYAPRSNFKKNTVYFKAKFEKEGRILLSKLGADTDIKPLTWSSIFDLIVVTGKNP
ncbi:MAG: hypothetical protein H8E10_18065 [Desulfobacterales bacterium]|nr:hypothetical protein [Desulfobacterales bacterium]